MATAKQAATTEKKTRAPKKVKTAAELKADLEKARAALKALEQRAYAEELGEAIKATKILDDYKTLKDKFKDVTELAILAAIGKAAGIPRLEITQKEAAKRAPRKKAS